MIKKSITLQLQELFPDFKIMSSHYEDGPPFRIKILRPTWTLWGLIPTTEEIGYYCQDTLHLQKKFYFEGLENEIMNVMLY